MFGQTIGKTMPFGFAGSYSRQPDTIIDSMPLDSASANVPFGMALVPGSGGTVKLTVAASVAADFVGVAVREVKTTGYNEVGQYVPGEAVPVIKRGCVNVLCQNGTPAYDGDVYMRVALNASYPNAVIGGFEAASDTTNSVKLTNVKWKGAADSNGIAEIRILNSLHA
jgi:hypothetical protein